MTGSKLRERVRLKRVYEPAEPADGTRVLVERLWPRGMTKDRAAIDVWLKDIAPSTQLRRWYGNDTARWDEFRRRYRAELEADAEPVDRLVDLVRHGPVTLVFAKKDVERSSAMVLLRHLERVLGDDGPDSRA